MKPISARSTKNRTQNFNGPFMAHTRFMSEAGSCLVDGVLLATCLLSILSKCQGRASPVRCLAPKWVRLRQTPVCISSSVILSCTLV